MPHKKICLASDNWTPAHPQVIQSVVEANDGFAPSYGADIWTERALKLIQDAFKSQCKIYIVPSGTGANVLALQLCCRKFESVLCTDIGHINYQESGAAESIVGCKLLTVPHKQGKITPAAIIKKLESERAFGKHSTSPRVLSIAQPTEVGTVYTLAELKALASLCHNEGLIFHVDGSRFYNAIAHMNVELYEFIEQVPVDIMSLGGTKNGLMGAEALLILNPELEKGSDHMQKQTLQLTSKMRYLSAQYIPLFKDQLWKSLALHANQKAQEIAKCILAIPQLSLSYPVESNQIFFKAPPAWIPLMQEKIYCYHWDKHKDEVRFIVSWNTSEQDVKDVKEVLTMLV